MTSPKISDRRIKMHPTDLIAMHVEMDTPETKHEICALTGVQCECVPLKSIISSSFTDGRLFAYPSSNWLGVNVYKAWKFEIRHPDKKRGFAPERNSCWVVNKTGWQYKLVKREIRDIALNGYDPPWSCWVTTGYKKHGSLRAVVNNSRFGAIALNESLADCSDVGKTKILYDTMHDMQISGFGRKILETLDCPPGYLKKYGFEKWNKYREWAKPFYQSALYQFVCYILPTKEEMES